MDSSTDLKPLLPPHSARTVSLATLLLVVFGAISGTVAVLMVVLYFTRGGTVGGLEPRAGASANPLVQTDTVQPHDQLSGMVFYPIPYISPPHLTLSDKRYVIAKQDETGFAWVDRKRNKNPQLLLRDFPGLSNILPEEVKGQGEDKGEQPAFTWEARGVPVGAEGTPFTQKGTFQSEFNQTGVVNYPFPYASPPNVELSGNSSKTIIISCTSTGFTWKNTQTSVKDGFASERGTVHWIAKGVKATSLPK